MLEDSGQEHELLVHVGASRSRRTDELYRLQLQGFLTFQPVRLDGEDLLTQHESSARTLEIESDVLSQSKHTDTKEGPSHAGMLFDLAGEVVPAHHSTLVEASPAIIVKRSPAGAQGFRPVPETPLGEQLARQAVSDGLVSKTSASAAGTSSVVLDTQHRLLERPFDVGSTKGSLLKGRLPPVSAIKRLKMDTSYSDSDSSTSYYVPAPETVSLTDSGVEGNGRNGSTLTHPLCPARDSQHDGVHDLEKPESTQEAYNHAAKELAAVIDLTKPARAIRSDVQELHQAQPPGSTVLPSLRTQPFTQSQPPIQPAQHASQPAPVHVITQTAPADQGETLGSSNHATNNLMESAEINQPSMLTQPEESRLSATKPAEKDDWPIGGNRFVSPEIQPKTSEAFTTHRMEILDNALLRPFGKAKASDLYNGVVVGSEPCIHDRGCWVFRVPSPPSSLVWPQKQRDLFFQRMAGVVRIGKLGPVSVEQLSAKNMAISDYGRARGAGSWLSGEPDDDWCRVFCWGEVYKQVWCVMLIASDGGILGLPSGMRWVVGDGDCRVIIPG